MLGKIFDRRNKTKKMEEQTQVGEEASDEVPASPCPADYGSTTQLPVAAQQGSLIQQWPWAR